MSTADTTTANIEHKSRLEMLHYYKKLPFEIMKLVVIHLDIVYDDFILTHRTPIGHSRGDLIHHWLKHTKYECRVPRPEWDISGTYKHHYYNGVLHSIGGKPAVETEHGVSWYKQGKLHRDNGPAEIDYKGTMTWYKNGKIHREPEPAVVHADGSVEFWIDGKRMYHFVKAVG